MVAQPEPLRILGLHGRGTSASIFKTQTAAFRAKLPPHITFDFLDAPFPCAPAPGTDVIFDSPHSSAGGNHGHYAWWPHPPTPAGIRAAHARLDEHLLAAARAGRPYDLLMGFSQGCSLIASYLLYRAAAAAREAREHERRESGAAEVEEKKTPASPCTFKAALFVCGGVPLAALDDLGVAVSARARRLDEVTGEALRQRTGRLAEYAESVGRLKARPAGAVLWEDLDGLVHDPGRMPDQRDVFGLDFTVMPPGLRIGIPTAHVYGAKDPRWPASLQLAYFCDDRRVYDHRGGHDIPRTTEVSLRMADLVLELEREIRKGSE